MAIKMRSPRYPAISLRDAIQKALAVYDSDHRNKIPKALVAQHMGYKTLNGASLGVISAVGKYGLLEGGAEAMNVTLRAVDIFEHDPGDPARVQAIREAAFAPDLFKEIASAFPGKVSDAAIRSHLITKLNFLPDAATNFVRTYRDTMLLVEAEAGNSDVPLDEDEFVPAQPLAPGVKDQLAQGAGGVLTHVTQNSPSVTSLEHGERELVTGILSKNGAAFRVVVSGVIGVKEIERLIRKLELDKEILADTDEDGPYDEDKDPRD